MCKFLILLVASWRVVEGGRSWQWTGVERRIADGVERADVLMAGARDCDFAVAFAAFEGTIKRLQSWSTGRRIVVSV